MKPAVMLAAMPHRPEDVPTADELLVLAQPCRWMAHSLGRFEALRVAEALRYLSALMSSGMA